MPFVSLKTKLDIVLQTALSLRSQCDYWQKALADPIAARGLVNIASSMRLAIDAVMPYISDAALSAYADEQFAGQPGWVPISIQIPAVKALTEAIIAECAARLTALGCLDGATGRLTLETFNADGTTSQIMLPPEQVVTVRNKLVVVFNAIPA